MDQPRFLSKEERAKLAIAKRTSEIKEQRAREEEKIHAWQTFEVEAQAIRREERPQKYGRHSTAGGKSSRACRVAHSWFLLADERQRYSKRDGRGRDDRRAAHASQQNKNGFENVPTAPRADRLKSSTATPSSSNPKGTPQPGSDMSEVLAETTSTFVPPMTESDLSAVRDRYLGINTKKRRIRKMNDRKFVFDWAEEDDTLASDSPIAVGANRQGAQVMFGRGRVGGMDDGGVAESGKSGHANLADALERKKASKNGLDERHWSEKPLNEMQERDWRIFREDFSIAARGMSVVKFGLSSADDSCRRIHSSSSSFLGGINHPSDYSRCNRKGWLQGPHSHPTTGYSNRSAES